MVSKDCRPITTLEILHLLSRSTYLDEQHDIKRVHTDGNWFIGQRVGVLRGDTRQVTEVIVSDLLRRASAVSSCANSRAKHQYILKCTCLILLMCTLHCKEHAKKKRKKRKRVGGREEIRDTR